MWSLKKNELIRLIILPRSDPGATCGGRERPWGATRGVTQRDVGHRLRWRLQQRGRRRRLQDARLLEVRGACVGTLFWKMVGMNWLNCSWFVNKICIFAPLSTCIILLLFSQTFCKGAEAFSLVRFSVRALVTYCWMMLHAMEQKLHWTTVITKNGVAIIAITRKTSASDVLVGVSYMLTLRRQFTKPAVLVPVMYMCYHAFHYHYTTM